jgi:hypothetical protein
VPVVDARRVRRRFRTGAAHRDAKNRMICARRTEPPP